MTFPVESDIPMPPMCARGWTRAEREMPRRYPFDVMDVGDSFVAPRAESKRVSDASFHYGRKHGRKFTVRKTEDGARCWRIA